ncbi:glycosyltransferase family 2 protein [Halobacillus ihumii]|uniref:glycosyltransferase family 2 protein n=1 Tax=Halobacillus ihumii TaxID=2686092 RepID=UPI0013D8B474|nr:glycosyltransferase family 2 protein [Halobacillus ihumii]
MFEPLVSIIMPVYNSEEYLDESIKSILNQTYKNFELILINDGSTDESINIINKFKDDRIMVYNNDGNKGLIKTLNIGLELSKGTYIARMDADDISTKLRIEKQVNFLKENLDISIVASNAIMFSDKYPWIKKHTSYNKGVDAIKCELLFQNRIFHPSVMFRKSIIETDKAFYNDDHIMCEDFGFWQLLADKNNIEVMKERLIHYRMSNTSITSKSRDRLQTLIQSQKEVYRQGLQLMDINFNSEELNVHTEISMANKIINFNFSLEEKEEWLLKIIKENDSSQYFNQVELKLIISEFYFSNCVIANNYKAYKKSTFYKINPLGIVRFKKERLKFLILNYVKPLIW